MIGGVSSSYGSTRLDRIITGEIQANQVTDKYGNPVRASHIEIQFNGSVEIRNNEGFTFEALVLDPVDDKEKLRRVNVNAEKAEGNKLIVHVDGPVSKGSVLTLNESGAIAVNGKSVDSAR